MSEKTRPIQKFTKTYLKECKKMKPAQIAKFLDDFRLAMGPPKGKCKGIYIKVEPELLSAFKAKSELVGERYQTRIKELMRKDL